MKKEKKIILSLIFLICIAIFTALVYAECTTKIYVYNSQGEMAASKVYGYCEKSGLNATTNTTDFYTFVIFGGIKDSCESLCGNVWIYATNEQTGLGGYSLYYPRNSTSDYQSYKNWSKNYEFHTDKITLEKNIKEIVPIWMQPPQLPPNTSENPTIVESNASSENLISNVSAENNTNIIENKTESAQQVNPTQTPITGQVIASDSEDKPLLKIKWIYIIAFLAIIIVIAFIIFLIRGRDSSPNFNSNRFRI